MKFNPTIATDAYKVTHWLQRPEGLTKFYSYGEPRLGGQHDKICFFGLQYIIKEYFMRKVTQEDIDRGFKRSKSVFGNEYYFPKHIWEKVKDLGYFPLRIKAVKEGTILGTSNVCFTIESTEEWFADMVSHFEDWLMWNWYSTGVATRAYNIKSNIKKSFDESCDNPFLQFAVTDFGLRGATFNEGACVGGAAHLIFFDGSDNIPAMDFIEEYYTDDNIGQSVWATEHSVATVWGPDKGEVEYIKAQLQRSAPEAIVSIVIDSYDADNFIKNIVGNPEIKQLIINKPGRVVLRPDSNDPLTNVCRYSEILGNIFGYHINNKGYKVLNHNVGLIQGDGMNERTIPEIYAEYIKTGWAAENFITGSGGGLLEEGLTRDTDRWAVKVSHVEINGQSVNVQKTPKSDLTKSSKAGRLILVENNAGTKKSSFSTYSSKDIKPTMFNSYIDSLETVYENGKLMRDQTFSEIRKIANSYV